MGGFVSFCHMLWIPYGMVPTAAAGGFTSFQSMWWGPDGAGGVVPPISGGSLYIPTWRPRRR